MNDEADAEWDAKKTKIRANHVAIVGRGRAGTAAIADEALDVSTLTIEEIAKLHSVEVSIIDTQLAMGIAVEKEHTTDPALAREIALDHLKEDPEYYSKLNKMEASDEATDVKLSDAEQIIALQAKFDDAEDRIATLTQKLADAEARLTDAAVSVIVKKRLAFLTDAAQFTDTDLTDMSEHDAMVLILQDQYGKDFSDKGAAYVAARYDILKENGVEGTSIYQALKDHVSNTPNEDMPQVSPAQESRERMIARNQKQ